MKPLSTLFAVAIATTCHAQAPLPVQVFSGAKIQSQTAALIASARASGSSGTKLGDYSSHTIEISVRTKSGGAEVHAHFDDIFLVTKGTATLITGGTVIDPTAEKNGETKGRGIRGGRSQILAKGDVVNIPAGTPHQLILAPGTIYASIVIKVREP